MKAKAVVWRCAAALVVSAWGQTAQAAAYEGVLTGTGVYVRSGPGGPGAYACAKLSKPAKVTVVDQLDDWLKIEPPTGCFSVISKQYVTVDPVTKTGTVTGDNVWVRAAGDLRSENFFSLQLRLNKGDRVTVIGEAGEYHKVQSPTGAYFWISAQYVGRTDGAAVEPTTRRVSVLPTTRPAPTTQRVVTTTPRARPLEVTTAEIEAFRAIENLLLRECMKPIEARELEPVLAKYRAIPVAGDSEYLKPYVEARIAFIQAAIERKRDLLAVKKLVTEVSEREQALQIEQAKLESEAPTTRPVTAFVTQGILLPSDVFPGGLGTPKRYIVRDRQTFFINAYVQCTTGAVNLEEHVGKHVGVMGMTRFDKNLGLDIVEATDAKVLASDFVFPRPPKPIIQPLPKPSPTSRPTSRPAPVVTPAPLVAPAPVVTPTPEPTTRPAPIVMPAPVVIPAPIITPIPKPTTRPAPIVTPATKPTTRPAPVVKPTPKPTPTVKPVVRFGPITPASMPTTKPAPTTSRADIDPTKRKVKPIVEKEYD